MKKLILILIVVFMGFTGFSQVKYPFNVDFVKKAIVRDSLRVEGKAYFKNYVTLDNSGFILNGSDTVVDANTIYDYLNATDTAYQKTTGAESIWGAQTYYGNQIFSGSTLTTLGVNENLSIDPNGTGKVAISAHTNITGAARVSQSGHILTVSDSLVDAATIKAYVDSHGLSDTASWHTYTATLSWTTATPVLNTGIYRFKNDGTTVHIMIYINFTTELTAPTDLNITVPITPPDIGVPIMGFAFTQKTGTTYSRMANPFIDMDDPTPANRKIYFGGGIATQTSTTYGYVISGFYEVTN